MPDKLKVITTIAMQRVLEQLEPSLMTATGLGVEMVFGPPSAAVKRVRDGEACDIVIATPDGIEELIRESLVAAGSGRTFCNLIMGIAVRAGATKPDISSVEGFKQAILDARSLIHADADKGSPSAAHFLKVARQLGILEAVRAKAIVRSAVVAHAVAAGEAEMAVQQMSELLLADGVDIVGPFPPELQNVLPLTAGVHAKAASPAAATALIGLLMSPGAKPIIEKAGLLPA